MNKVKVSACIITFNQANFIRECLDGALLQKTDFDYEIIVGDDCSTDGTTRICREYAEKYPNIIRLLERDNNLGMTGNWIETIGACTGKYIAICEGDDYWTDPEKLQNQVDFLEGNPDYVLSFHSVNVLNVRGELVDDFITSVPEDYENMEILAKFGNYIHTPSVVYRNIINEFPFEFRMSPVCDFFLYMMLAKHGKIHYSTNKMCVYRFGVGVFSNKSLVTKIKASNKLYTCLLSYLTDDAIKKIILERQMKTLDVLGDTIEQRFTGGFVLNNQFFRGLKYISRNFFEPTKIALKFKSKLKIG